MGRFEPTGQVEVSGLGHSVVSLQWSLLRGALGPSDGSLGALSNVPSALSVLRHAPLYTELPEEIEEAFCVLERHALRHRLLYPVAIAILPFLFDIVRRDSPLTSRITDLIGEYVVASGTLDQAMQDQLFAIVVDHGAEIAGWIGRDDRGDRASAALAIHIPALRANYLGTVAHLIARDATLSPVILLALGELELGESLQLDATRIAIAHLDQLDQPPLARMAAAAFLARTATMTPDLRTRVDAALPPTAAGALANLVKNLWSPTITRPVVAPRLCEAEVVFVGEKLVLVRAGAQSITLPWAGAQVQRGDRMKVGITVHGQAKLALITEDSGSVRVIDF